VAGGVAGATSAVALYLAGQHHPLWELAGVLAAPPLRLGPFPWFAPVPWPLPLLIPLGMALAGVQAGLYYRWCVDPATDVREALADWVARRPTALQVKLRAGFLLVVAATLLVGWLGFGALENTAPCTRSSVSERPCCPSWPPARAKAPSVFSGSATPRPRPS
jgi:hypothetical protein